MDRMNAAWHGLLIGLPVLLGHLALTTGLFVFGLAILTFLAPCRIIARLRQGDLIVAVIFSAQMLGLGIPLSAMMVNSVNLAEIVLWGIVTFVLQVLANVALRLLLPGLPEQIRQGNMTPALVYLSGQIVAGLLNAAALSG